MVCSSAAKALKFDFQYFKKIVYIKYFPALIKIISGFACMQNDRNNFQNTHTLIT